MPQQAWKPQRERQYQQARPSASQRSAGRGRPAQAASRTTQVASRTATKERARAGDVKTASRTAKKSISSNRRTIRAHQSPQVRTRPGPQGRTREQLYEEARKRNIRGRSTMTKNQLARAVGRR